MSERRRFADAAWPGTLRPYQTRVLDRLAAEWAKGRGRAWVVLPPGAGKTLVGLEAARRLGRTVVVFVPNTAIQGQWAAHWEHFGGTAATRRSLDAEVNVLTYQALAVFDPDAETDEEGRERGLVRRLHTGGHELIAALKAAGPLTIVLDECHHLLDVWGRLLAEVLDELADAMVIGLTATPPESLTSTEAALVDRLFGTPVLGTSIPALVRDGYLAPFAELAWVARPSAAEDSYIASEAERFTELTTDLTDPDVGFLSWLDARFVDRRAVEGGRLPWPRLEHDEPELAAAALRLHHAGLLGLPPGARPREEHRHAPDAEDWVALLNDYVKSHLLSSDDAKDAELLAAVRRALPAVGYRLTRRGIRAARSPVDRVLARSAAKTYGAVEIAATEATALGDRLRCLVLCDHERAGARLPARLHDVLAAEAGSARLTLECLVADPRTRALAPMMVTGRTVAAGIDTARDFVARHPGLTLVEDDGLAVIDGDWSSRTWVPLVTAYFEAGHCRALVGTRALLGEGWDAHGVNALIDLTTATTATSVVQTRGRALRLDPAWPDKVAHSWTVVCVTEAHPKGAADWRRFVRKHGGYLAATPDGEIVSGVAHVDAAFSPYAPPPAGELDGVNTRMRRRAEDRRTTRTAWRIGTGFRDELVHTLRVRTPRTREATEAGTTAAPSPPVVVPAATCAVPKAVGKPPGPLLPALFVAVAGCVGGLDIVVSTTTRVVLTSLLLPLAVVLWIVPWVVRVRRVSRAVRLLDAACEQPSAARFAYAVADGLVGAGLSRRGADGVTVAVEPDGTYRFSLADVDTATSERFAIALDEVLAPVASPRYMIPRYIVRPRSGRPARRRSRDWLCGKARSDGVAYHAVPSVLGRNKTRTTAFAQAWNRWVSDGEPVYASSAEGAGVMATHHGEDPFAATTVLRLAWD